MPIQNPGLPLPPSKQRLRGSRSSALRSLRSRIGNQPAEQKPPRWPVQPAQPKRKYWTSNSREILGLITQFARERKKIIIRYRAKKHGGAVVTRQVEPYALRFKTGRLGRNRYFYAYDGGEGNPTSGIHCFLLGNIVSVQGTDLNYRDRWRVEF